MIKRDYVIVILISLLGYMFMVFMDTIIKFLGNHYPIFQILFINSLFSIIPIIFFLFKFHGLQFYKNQTYKFQIIRGLLFTGGFLFVLNGVIRLPLSVVYPIIFLAPLILLILSHFFLDENINIIRVCAIILGFVGVFISAEPFSKMDISEIGVFMVFIGAIFIAITNLITRKYSRLASPYQTAFFSTLVSIIIYAVITNSQDFILMSRNHIFISLLGGFFTGFGVVSIIYGSRMLPTYIFGMTSYFQLVYGIILGWLVFSQLPTNYNIMGIIFVILAGSMLYFKDQSKN